MINIKTDSVIQYAIQKNHHLTHRRLAKKILKVMAAGGVRTPTSYQDLLPQLDFAHSNNRRDVGAALGIIFDYCREHNYPPITMLVVRKDNGLPGEGMYSYFKDKYKESCRDKYAIFCRNEMMYVISHYLHGLLKVS